TEAVKCSLIAGIVVLAGSAGGNNTISIGGAGFFAAGSAKTQAGHQGRRPAWNSLDVVSALIVESDVQTGGFFLRAHAQTHDGVKNFEKNKGYHCRIGKRGANPNQLHAYLGGHVHALVISLAAEYAELIGGEDAGKNSTDNATYAVHREHIQRLINFEFLLDRLSGKITEDAGT